jgi:phosphatidylglycerophosphate synthase
LIGSKIGHALDPILINVYRLVLGQKVVSPNVLTLCGLLFGFIAALCIALDRLALGGAALLISGFFDLLDGSLARTTGNMTRFGGFLDSVVDRYTDLAVMFGVFLHFWKQGSLLYTSAVFVAAIGIAVIPYAKARAEAASISCNTGLLERPERLVLLIIGLFFGVLPYVLLILVVLTHVTVIQRILHVRRAARTRED